MRCPHCDNELTTDARFCGRCGAPVMAAPTPRRRTPRWPLWLLLGLVGAFLGYGGAWLWQPGDQQTEATPTRASWVHALAPTATPTPTQTPSPTPSLTPSLTATATPTWTPTATWTPSPTATANPITFDERFNDLSLPAWRVDAGSGSLLVSAAGLSLASDATRYPYLVTRDDPFPAQGDFSASWRFRYSLVRMCGVGVLLSSDPPPVGLSEMDTGSYQAAAERTGVQAGVWQDAQQGLLYWFRSGDERATVPLRGIDTDWHTLQIAYRDGVYTASLDGAPVHSSRATPYRPTAIWIGNAAKLAADCAWSSLTVASLAVQSESTPGALVAPQSTGGQIVVEPFDRTRHLGDLPPTLATVAGAETAKAPGELIYELTIYPDTPLRIVRGWCAKDAATLQQNLTQVSRGLVVDGETYDLDQLTFYTIDQPNWHCAGREGLVRAWSLGDHEVLGIRDLAAPIFDGWDYYEAGRYLAIHRVHVIASP